MRIWIINHYAVPPTNPGGTRHYNFAKHLIQRGHDVTIIAANFNHFSHTTMHSTDKIGKVDHTHEVPFVWIPTPSYRGNTFARFWNMLLFSSRILRKKNLPLYAPPDIVIGSSPHLFGALAALLLARRYKKPFILEIRDIWPDTLVDLGRISKRHLLIKLMKYIERYLYKHADRIISLLPGANEYLKLFGVNPDHILSLPNMIDSEIIPKNISYPPNDIFTIMYAGAHGLANDLETIIQAAKILKNKNLDNKIRICLVGEGPDKLRLKKLAIQNNIYMVEFIDAVSKNEIYNILNKAHAFIMLLKKSPIFRWGISPNKLFDYLAMGRPIIFGVDTPYNPIETCKSGLTVHPSDPEDLANAIHKLSLLSSEERKEMGAQGRKFVLEHHDIKELTSLLENLMTELHTSYVNV